jgi:KipI family sensor histidine kinase inhibitor
MPVIEPLGDRALLARFDTEDGAARWAAAVRAHALPEVLDVVPAYRSVAVFPDPVRTEWPALERRLSRIEPVSEPAAAGRRIVLPVRYDGPDLPDVMRRTGLTATALIAAHTGLDYTVFAVGFLPGFPYAGYLPASLSGQPRRDSPRTRVPAGSVAIAGRQTGVYPVDSPGGWSVIGRTPLTIADLAAGHFPIRAGDQLRFVAISTEEYARRAGEWLQ